MADTLEFRYYTGFLASAVGTFVGDLYDAAGSLVVADLVITELANAKTRYQVTNPGTETGHHTLHVRDDGDGSFPFPAIDYVLKNAGGLRLPQSPLDAGVAMSELTEDDGGGNLRYTEKSLEQAPGGNASITVVVAASSVAAQAANDAGLLTIVRYSTWRARITLGQDLTNADNVVFTIKNKVKTLGSTEDSSAKLQVDLVTGLLIVEGEAASDETLASIEIVTAETGVIDVYIDEEVTPSLTAGVALPYSFKVLDDDGDDIEVTNVDFSVNNSTPSYARVLEPVTRQT